MKSVKGKALRGKIVVLIVLGMLFLLHPSPFTLHPALAADSSPSADIKIKLEELKKEIASKAAKLKQEVNTRLQNKAYVGNVKSKSDQSITLASRTGPKMISINQDTVYESRVKSKTKFSFKTLAEEDYIAALGDVDETAVLTAKKIVLLPATNYEPKTYLWGQVISISDKLFTIKARDFKNVSATHKDSSVLKINNFVILTGKYNKNNIFEAEFAYVIPQGGILKPKNTATPSAKPS
ncbi:hypothetical protein KKE03_04670 [Patescibacteria group bacterium]|nr:hypothetical protein [Patescibacteria group bacterium]